MEPTQILKVTIAVADAWDKETFIARMGKDGRIAIPKLTRHVLQGKDDLHDYVLEVNLEPAEPTPRANDPSGPNPRMYVVKP